MGLAPGFVMSTAEAKQLKEISSDGLAAVEAAKLVQYNISCYKYAIHIEVKLAKHGHLDSKRKLNCFTFANKRALAVYLMYGEGPQYNAAKALAAAVLKNPNYFELPGNLAELRTAGYAFIVYMLFLSFSAHSLLYTILIFALLCSVLLLSRLFSLFSFHIIRRRAHLSTRLRRLPIRTSDASISRTFLKQHTWRFYKSDFPAFLRLRVVEAFQVATCSREISATTIFNAYNSLCATSGSVCTFL